MVLKFKVNVWTVTLTGNIQEKIFRLQGNQNVLVC